MKLNSFLLTSALALAVGGAACSGSPAKPTGTVTTTVAGQASPDDGAQIPNGQQPVTLTIVNAASTGSGARTYTFEVASDSAFTHMAFAKSGIAEGAGGHTSLTIDTIAPATTYYWRSRVHTGSDDGPNSTPRSFAIGPAVVLQTPSPVNPLSSGTLSGQATLTVANIQRSGPVGTIYYTFDVADSSSFSNIIFSNTVQEQGGTTTSTTVTAQLAGQVTYWWRVQASDPQNGVTTSYSDPQSFQYQNFDMRQASIMHSPPDLGSWAETAHVTLVQTSGSSIILDFDKRTGPNRWPDVGFGAGSLEYTLGMCLNVAQHWYCSAVVQFWYGRELTAGGVPWEVALNWYYDPARWGPMAGHQPANGEIVGMFAGAGNLRGTDGNVRVKERTNVQMIPWRTDFSASSLQRIMLKSTASALKAPFFTRH